MVSAAAAAHLLLAISNSEQILQKFKQHRIVARPQRRHGRAERAGRAGARGLLQKLRVLGNNEHLVDQVDKAIGGLVRLHNVGLGALGAQPEGFGEDGPGGRLVVLVRLLRRLATSNKRVERGKGGRVRLVRNVGCSLLLMWFVKMFVFSVKIWSQIRLVYLNLFLSISPAGRLISRPGLAQIKAHKRTNQQFDSGAASQSCGGGDGTYLAR